MYEKIIKRLESIYLKNKEEIWNRLESGNIICETDFDIGYRKPIELAPYIFGEKLEEDGYVGSILGSAYDSGENGWNYYIFDADKVSIKDAKTLARKAFGDE